MSWPTHIVACGGYVFDQNGNLLLIKTQHRGYDCTGGQVENGENLEEAVLREILEESGITARVKCLCGIYSSVAKRIHYDGVTPIPTIVNIDFICEYISGTPRTSDESSEVVWVPREKVMDYVTSPVQRYRFEKGLNFNGTVTYGSYIAKPEFKILSERSI